MDTNKTNIIDRTHIDQEQDGKDGIIKPKQKEVIKRQIVLPNRLLILLIIVITSSAILASQNTSKELRIKISKALNSLLSDPKTIKENAKDGSTPELSFITPQDTIYTTLNDPQMISVMLQEVADVREVHIQKIKDGNKIDFLDTNKQGLNINSPNDVDWYSNILIEFYNDGSDTLSIPIAVLPDENQPLMYELPEDSRTFNVSTDLNLDEPIIIKFHANNDLLNYISNMQKGGVTLDVTYALDLDSNKFNMIRFPQALVNSDSICIIQTTGPNGEEDHISIIVHTDFNTNSIDNTINPNEVNEDKFLTYENPYHSGKPAKVNFSDDMKQNIKKLKMDFYNAKGQYVCNIINTHSYGGEDILLPTKDRHNKPITSGMYLIKYNINDGEFTRIAKVTFLN